MSRIICVWKSGKVCFRLVFQAGSLPMTVFITVWKKMLKSGQLGWCG